MGVIISEILKNLRKEKGISQETLAEYMGVSVQAVSKWENNLSYPDIEFLPTLSGYYNVSIDYLLTGVTSSTVSTCKEENSFPDDNIYRIVQFKGKQLLTYDTYDYKNPILLKLTEDELFHNHIELELHIWGSASISGNVYGNLRANDSVDCGAVTGNINANDSINCGAIVGNVSAGDSISCGSIMGNVTAGDGVDCGNVSGDVNAGDSVNCGDVIGNVTASDSVSCGNIKGNAYSEGEIYCTKIASEEYVRNK